MKNLLLLLFMVTCLNVLAQDDKRSMAIVDFLNIPGVSSPRISPDGTKLIYILSESNWKANKQISHIWLVKSDGKDAHQITFGPGGVSSPSWSPDGRWISFIAKRNDDKENQIYLMRADGGEGRRLTNQKTAVGSHHWSPGSKTIYFLANDTLSKEEEKAKELKDDVYSLDEDYKQKHLWTVNLKNSDVLRITEGDYSILNYDISKDGRRLVVHRGPNPLIDYYKESEIWIMDIDGSNPRQLTENKIGENEARLSPDGKQVLFTAFANEHFDFYYNDKIFLMAADGNGKSTVPLKDLPYEVQSAEWSTDGRSIYFIANMGSQSQLWQYELSAEKLSQITAGKHSVGQWEYQR